MISESFCRTLDVDYSVAFTPALYFVQSHPRSSHSTDERPLPLFFVRSHYDHTPVPLIPPTNGRFQEPTDKDTAGHHFEQVRPIGILPMPHGID